jgi:hypothetical protein
MGTAFLLIILGFVIGFTIGFGGSFIPSIAVRLMVQTVLQAALFLFGTAAWVIFYFSCRAKAEQFDLHMLADAVGVDEPGAEGGMGAAPEAAG